MIIVYVMKRLKIIKGYDELDRSECVDDIIMDH